ncbi:MAG: Uma2 family endonuclease [Leptolyngbyaceae cyanobacterium SM1_1_3]|nr:Uma2 family endonuclease [Leptolyngbyaceae cyanobacterium SM1_1_3]NJM85617.1 Uma2 family endonuclease [Leptolyngbyaceae cyanobacterium RM2_2_21]NJN02079.1 Uma2 family endonuclease [Leptolyngbyaceae cyanobacterium RM1_1_2]NJO09686.1 Uma2 family endonuclease [Leptolyngbyaceae cyanobacterium SL_1_1]
MFALVSPEKIRLPPGAVVYLPGTWQDYRSLAAQRGDASVPRIKYRSHEILLMAPSAEHGRDANLMADVVKVLLDSLEQEYEAFTPITLELPEQGGIEPDYCFYIENWPAVAGRTRLQWGIDPPPDLVIEVDVTSYTNVEDYLPYQVPEVWLLKKQQLMIYLLQTNQYGLQTQSRYFPDMDLQALICRCLKTTYERNSSAAIRELRQYLTQRS